MKVSVGTIVAAKVMGNPIAKLGVIGVYEGKNCLFMAGTMFAKQEIENNSDIQEIIPTGYNLNENVPVIPDMFPQWIHDVVSEYEPHGRLLDIETDDFVKLERAIRDCPEFSDEMRSNPKL